MTKTHQVARDREKAAPVGVRPEMHEDAVDPRGYVGATRQGAARRGAVVLIVDDSEQDLLWLRTVLERSGYQVRSVENGQEALALVRGEAPDLIISDILMPLMDGFQLCHQIRSDPSVPDIPLIFHTATYTDEQDERYAFDTGCDAFVQKSAEPEDFLAVVREVLERPRPDRSPGPMRDRSTEAESLRLYSERLIHKLEQKTQDLEAQEAIRKEAEEDLRLHAAALRAAPNGVVITDREGRIGWVNPAFEELSGYPADELVGENPRIVNAGVQSTALYDDLWRTVLGGSPWVGQLTNRRKDGSRWTSNLSVTPVRDGGGDVSHFVAIHEDVSERTRHVEALRRSEERLRGVVERAPYGIFRSTVDGRFIAANPAMVRMLGYDGEAELLAVDLEQAPFLDRGDWSALVEGVMGADDFGSVEVIGTRRDGSPVHLRLHGMVERAESGEVTALEVFAEDVTLSYELENQLRQSQKLEAIGSLTGGIAHDLNNLLTVIGGNAELARSSGAVSGDVAACMVAIEGAARRGGTTMKRLLGFSRKADLDLVPLDLAARIEDLAPMLRGVVPESIELVLETPPVRAVIADGGAVEQIVINLVNNARDAMEDGGRLTLSVADRRVGEDEFELRPWVRAGEFVCVSVTDTGIGMDEETRLRIFEPFFTTKEEGAGTGLGLAMVYGLMKQHGGFAYASQAAGRGTVMSLLFPAADCQAPTDASRPALLEGVLGGCETVLLVEDQGDVRRLCAKALRRAGYTVITAADGVEGLGAFRERSADIDLVVSDLVMPKMGGQALFEQLLKEFGRVPFILSSGYRERDRDKGLDSLDVPFLPKPWEITDLLRTVRRVLDAPPGGLPGA